MQATATLPHTNRRRFIPLALALGLIATVALIALLNWGSGSESEAVHRPLAPEFVSAAGQARFLAINELPEPAVSARPAVNYRFLEMNRLPEAPVAAGALAGQSLYRFLEWNLALGGSDAEGHYPVNDLDGQPN